MPNCKRHSSGTAVSLCSSADELKVAGILLNLPGLVKESESSNRFLPLWSVRKKRSSIDGTASDSPAPPSNSAPVTGKLDTLSTSPVSPMAFPSSTESDLKPLRPKKKSSLGLKIELLKESKRLTDLREQLQREVKKVEAYRDILMAENTALQARRQQVEKALLALPSSQSQSLVPVAHPQPYYLFHYQPIGSTNFDTKGSPEKCTARLENPQPSDLLYHYRIWMAAVAESRAAAALARRNRRLILKAKNYNRVPRGSRR